MFNSTQSIDDDNPLPRHAQIQKILRDMVLSEQLKGGDKIPSETTIAAALGVSKMTVNKALLALTAEGIFVRKVGRGTFVAPTRPRRNDRPRVVVSFVEGAQTLLDSDYYAPLYRGFVSYFDDENIGQIVLAPNPPAPDYVEEAARLNGDGWLVVAPRRESLASLRALAEQGGPLVIIGATWDELPAVSVDSDNHNGAMQAVNHLIELGHRRIALVYAEPNTANTQDRIAGYRAALMQANLPLDPALEIQAQTAWHIGSATRERIAACFRPQSTTAPATALFGAGYYMALESQHVLRELKLRIPDDVSVAGFDDPLSARLVYPPLTTVRQPLADMGRRAAERLVALIQGRSSEAPYREIFPCQLIVRRSTAPPP